MKNIKNNNTKVAGELAMRAASFEAWKFYVSTEPLQVYEYETEDGKRYAYEGVFGENDGMTFEELQNLFEEIQNELDGLEEYEEEEDEEEVG